MENTVLCGANSYTQKFYLSERYSRLPEAVKNELQILCVWFTEDVGGIIVLEFDEEGSLLIRTEADEMDYYYDEIGAGLKVRRLQKEKKELFSSLELYNKALNGKYTLEDAENAKQDPEEKQS